MSTDFKVFLLYKLSSESNAIKLKIKNYKIAKMTAYLKSYIFLSSIIHESNGKLVK